MTDADIYTLDYLQAMLDHHARKCIELEYGHDYLYTDPRRMQEYIEHRSKKEMLATKIKSLTETKDVLKS